MLIQLSDFDKNVAKWHHKKFIWRCCQFLFASFYLIDRNNSWCKWHAIGCPLKRYNNPADTERKLNVHKTFRRRPGRLLNVLCTFNLRPVSTGKLDFSVFYKDLAKIWRFFINASISCGWSTTGVKKLEMRM